MWAEAMRRRRLLAAGLERKLCELEAVEAGEAVVRACFDAMLIEQLSDAAAELSRAEHRLERARSAADIDLIRLAEAEIREHMHVLRAILYHCAEHTRCSRQSHREYLVRQGKLQRRLSLARAIARRGGRRVGRRSTRL